MVAGQTATFSVAADGSALSYEWLRNGQPISGAGSAQYTTPPTTVSDNGSRFVVVIHGAGSNTETSNSALLTVVPPADVLTYHNDNARTGQNLAEEILTSSNVNSTQFGKLAIYKTDDFVDAQPLYVSNVITPTQGTHNLLIVVTENDSIYAFDADSGATVWQASLSEPGEAASDDPGCPTCHQIGMNATPVIDRTRGPNGAIYIVATTKDESSNYRHRLHALDLAIGTELFNGPTEIHATYPGTGDNSDGTNVIFDPMQYRERASLLLLNGVVYTSWASHYDVRPYTGWIIGYDASTLAQTSVLNLTPNGTDGAIWMSGAGPAADSSGNIYILDGNGLFDTTLNSSGFPVNGDYGNAFVKLSTTGNQLAVADYFEMYNQEALNAIDADLGSGGAMVLPDMTDASGHVMHLAVGAGKDGNIYVVNRESMGKFSLDTNNIYQELPIALINGVWSSPAYFNQTIYYTSVGNPIRAFSINNATLSGTPVAQTATTFPYPGATPAISASNSTSGIVWAVENAPLDNSTPAVLHAYDAASLGELYNSNQAGTRDQFGFSTRFVTPTIANGKVFVGTLNGVAVFGLLPQQ